jgi:hypothetical protein
VKVAQAENIGRRGLPHCDVGVMVAARRFILIGTVLYVL